MARLLRALRSLGLTASRAEGLPLEALHEGADEARVSRAPLLETPQRRRAVPALDDPRAKAFLDGTQESRVLTYIDALPLVEGVAKAAITVREERRLRRWESERVVRAVYAPRTLLLDDWGRFEATFAADGYRLVDTLGDPDASSVPADGWHPDELMRMALLANERQRESLEQELASVWADRPEGLLYVDGGLPPLASSIDHGHRMVGVVKTMRQLHVAPEFLVALAPGERTSVMQVEGRRRQPVASWYLRLRDIPGNPYAGIVRVESERREADAATLAADADALSAAVLAERRPLALPDWRWDRMAYGVAHVESYLDSRR